MNNNKSRMIQMVAVLCFMLSTTAVGLGTYLVREGQIPKLRLAPHVFIGFGNVDTLSNVFSPIFVTALYVTAVALFFMGYRFWKPRT